MSTTHQQMLNSGDRDYWDSHSPPGRIDRDTLERLSDQVALADGVRDSIDVRAPFTGEILGRLPSATPDDIAGAVAKARKAQPAWAARSIHERASVLLRFHELLLDRREEVLDLIQLESGKARRHAFEEVLDTAVVARHYAFHAKSYLRRRRHPGAIPLFTAAWEYRHPIGVVGFIAPWNFPLILGITDVIAALMAGNSAILRPDLQSSFTALWAADLLNEAGLPRDVLQIVTGEGPVLGPVLIGLVDFLMFTGSTKTGKVIASQAAGRLIGYSLELGGKNPMIVLPDADIRASVEGLVRGAFVGAGQVCVSIERAYVPAVLYDDFVGRLMARIQKMTLGAGFDLNTEMGSLTVPRQLASVAAHVEDAVEKGAVLLAGGRARPDLGPLFYEPTVLHGVTPSMRVYAEETFGPMVCLYPYVEIDEAIEQANETPYGLNASVWSGNWRAAVRVAQRIKAGTVNVNGTYAASWTATGAPIGGMKQSGMGRRHGAEGILKYTEAQTVALERGLELSGPSRWLPASRYARLMPPMLRLMRHLPGLR